MTARRWLGSLAMVLVMSIAAILALMIALAAYAGLPAIPLSALSETASRQSLLVDPPPLGEACGAGEQLPPWVICLHGTVSQIDAWGRIAPLNGVPLTVTLGNRIVTGTTFIHPGQLTPTYGIDISPLEPGFLNVVTVSAKIGVNIVERRVIVYPDFATQSQLFNLVWSEIVALDPIAIWGYVVDFSAGGPVTGAAVIAKRAGQSVAVTTTWSVTEAAPIYTLGVADLTAISAQPGDAITLAARYQGDTDQRVVIWNGELLQIDLITGWKCDDFDPLPRTAGGQGMPRTAGGQGMPRTAGGQGMPDVACFWGYGVVDGVPREGVSVRLEISGTVYEGRTRFYPGETLPRYGIGVWSGQAISGTAMTATAVYGGFVAERAVTITLDVALGQNVDFNIKAQPHALESFMESRDVYDLIQHAGYLWVAAGTGGVVRLDPQTLEYIQFDTDDGLINNTVKAIAADSLGSLWFGTDGGVSEYTPSGGQAWRSFTVKEGLVTHTVNAIAIGTDDSVWVGTNAGISHYFPYTNTWETFTETHLGFIPIVYDAAVNRNDGTVWFALDGASARYSPRDQTWITYTQKNSDLCGLIFYAVEVNENDNSVWFGALGAACGVSHYYLDTQTWVTYTASITGLASKSLRSIAVGPDNSLWFGTSDSGVSHLSHYAPGDTPEWENFAASNSGLGSDWVSEIVVERENSIWFGSPLTHYTPGAFPEWKTITTTKLANMVEAIAQGEDGALWFGGSGGVSRYSPNNSPEWESFTQSNSGLLDDNVTSAVIGLDGVLWFSTVGGVSGYDFDTRTWTTLTTGNSILINDYVTALTVDASGSLWIGTEDGVNRYEPSTQMMEIITLTTNDVTSLATGLDGSLWFGVRSKGLYHYYPGSQTWEVFTITQGLVLNSVRSIVAGQDGSVWFGTQTGISHYIPGVIPTWEIISTVTAIRAMAMSADGVLWFSSSNMGVGRYLSGARPELQRFTVADGLPSNDINTIFITGDGALWFGTNGGVSHWEAPSRQSELLLTIESPQTVLSGQTLTYTLHITSQGEAPARNVIVTFTLPSGTASLSATLPPDNVAPLAWAWTVLPVTIAPTVLTVTAAISSEVMPGTWLTAAASVATTSPEAFIANNNAQVATYVRDPDRADVRLSLQGPPLLTPDQEAAYHIWVDNVGGLEAQTTTLMVTLPAGLAYHSAVQSPSSLAPLAWDLGMLPPLTSLLHIALTATAASTLPVGTDVAVSASITTASPDSNLSNNMAVITVSASLTDALTLILAAPERLAARYGASFILSKLYLLASHPQVRGVVLDVLSDQAVKDAYAAWDADPGDWQKANAVAGAIKALINQYTLSYSNLRYLVFVGSDGMIPFYRVRDQNPTMWRERNYSIYVPPGTVQAALAADMLLTDDFYADRFPIVPSSSFWTDGHPFYLPDLATGRLVETPEDIAAVIDAFLASDGVISLGPALVGAQVDLAGDLSQAQCSAFTEDNLSVTCTASQDSFRQSFLNLSSGSAWAALHSSHSSIGSLYATDIFNRTQAYTQTLLVTIGCHAGLSVPKPEAYSLRLDFDLPQAMLGRGGVFLGSLTYAYASPFGVSYSEALALELTNQLLITHTQELGPALVRTKHAYYANHGWFDYTDEKVLLPVTLYGLPMLRVTTPGIRQPAPTTLAVMVHPVTALLDGLTVVTYTLSGLTFTQHMMDGGVYYDYAGQVIAQDGLPVQPAFRIPLSPTVAGQTVRWAVLYTATYTHTASVTPPIAQSWAIGEERLPSRTRIAVAQAGWDRPLPYSIGHSEGLTETVASLNLVLGAFNSGMQAERLFTDLILEVFYSNSPDLTPPVISSVGGYTAYVRATVTDTVGVAQATAVCDDGEGYWRNVVLTPYGGDVWEGKIPPTVERCYIQALDSGGNGAIYPWFRANDPTVIGIDNFTNDYTLAVPAAALWAALLALGAVSLGLLGRLRKRQ